MSLASAFSNDYLTARERFRTLASAVGLHQESHPLGGFGPGGELLTLDLAMTGPESSDCLVVVSSGLHGVEGFFGSAVQVAFLEQIVNELVRPTEVSLLLLHALDPFGFAWLRRTNEKNVDLNRNFLLPSQEYRGSSPIYAAVNDLINPRYPPDRFDLFPIRALLANLRHGRQRLKQAVAGGQYDFPQGLFFGGHAPSPTQQLLAEHLPRWVGLAKQVIHIDFHTGLGRWGTSKLLIDDQVSSPRARRLARWFGPDAIASSTPSGIAYRAWGDMGTWCREIFDDRQYDFVCAEIGTYSNANVFQALRAENQAHHWGQPESPVSTRVKRNLLEAFAPANGNWRAQVVDLGLTIIHQAINACSISPWRDLCEEIPD